MAHASDLLSQPGSYGSVVFRYTSPSAGNLYANVVLSIHGEPISFPIVARPSWSIPGRTPSSLEGIWWQPRANLNDVLVISNSSDAKISGALILSDASGKQWTQNTPLGPRQTLRFSTSELISKAGLSGSYGGISFVPQSPSDGIDAVHFLYDEVSKFSAALDLSSRYPQMSLQERAGPDAKHWTMRAPMLALQSPDPSLGLPRGIALQPTLFIRNTTAKNITADLSLTWRGDSGKGQAKLPQLRLGPFATQQVQIAGEQSLLQIPNNAHWGMVTLTTDALPDDLVAFATSIDSSGRYNLATRFAGGVGGHFTGGEWDFDANHNQIAAITNIGSKPTDALLTLHYDNGKKRYEFQQTIAPGDQMWVNLAQLVRNRVADRNGSTLPADVSSVTYDVKDLTPGGYGLMVNPLATNSSYGFGAGKLNANCCSYNDPTWIPDAFTFDGAGGDDPADIGATDSCDGDVYNESIDFTTWSSDNTAVAVVTAQNVRAAGAGSATGTAVGHLFQGVGSYCAYTPVQSTVPITVQVPTSLKVVKVTVLQTGNTGNHGCLAGYYGIQADIEYQVLDQQAPPQPISNATMTPQEHVVFWDGTTKDGNIGPTYISTTSQTTRADGTFDDAPVGACKSVPFSTPLTTSQDIKILLSNGITYTVRHNDFKFSSTNLTNHGTVTNGSDITATQ